MKFMTVSEAREFAEKWLPAWTGTTLNCCQFLF